LSRTIVLGDVVEMRLSADENVFPGQVSKQRMAGWKSFFMASEK